MSILRGHLVVILTIIVAVGCLDVCLAQKKAKPSPARASSRSILSPLPASLEALYPPKAGQPVFLLRMFGVNMTLTGIAVDLFENDLDPMPRPTSRSSRLIIRTFQNLSQSGKKSIP